MCPERNQPTTYPPNQPTDRIPQASRHRPARTRAGAPRGPVLEDGPPDDVVPREEAPDVRVQAVVPVVAQHHVHALLFGAFGRVILSETAISADLSIAVAAPPRAHNIFNKQINKQTNPKKTNKQTNKNTYIRHAAGPPRVLGALRRERLVLRHPVDEELPVLHLSRGWVAMRR